MKEARYDEDQVAWNPSRLVMGTNAVLKVGANGDFSPSEVRWSVVSGPGVVFPTNGWETTVTPMGLGTVTVEARFNDDEIQPRFVLPVVQPRTIYIKVFSASKRNGKKAVTPAKVDSMIAYANAIYSQSGVSFELQGGILPCGGPDDWDLTMYDIVECHIGDDDLSYEEHTPQYMRIIKPNVPGEGIEVFFVGTLKYAVGKGAEHFALTTSKKIIIPTGFQDQTLAHEIGHTFGLKDIYLDTRFRLEGESDNWRTLEKVNRVVMHDSFGDHVHDWGAENGRGFYGVNDTHGRLVKKLLMYGLQEPNEISEDLPSATVWGVTSYERDDFIMVGSEYVDEKEGKENHED